MSKLVARDRDGNIVERGTEISSGNGREYVYQYPTSGGRKVYVTPIKDGVEAVIGQEFYPGVFGLTVGLEE